MMMNNAVNKKLRIYRKRNNTTTHEGRLKKKTDVINIKLTSLDPNISFKLHSSIGEKLNVINTSLYLPHFENYIDIGHFNINEVMQQYIYNTKYKFIELLDVYKITADETKTHIEEEIYNDKGNIKLIRVKLLNGYKTIERNAILKIIPILNPLKNYVISHDFESWMLPHKYNKKAINRVNDVNNPAYVESFFLYLGSLLVENNKCPAFPYYYGCVNGIKDIYYHNINDEYDYLENCEWFNRNEGITFELIKHKKRDSELDSDSFVDSTDDEYYTHGSIRDNVFREIDCDITEDKYNHGLGTEADAETDADNMDDVDCHANGDVGDSYVDTEDADAELSTETDDDDSDASQGLRISNISSSLKSMVSDFSDYEISGTEKGIKKSLTPPINNLNYIDTDELFDYQGNYNYVMAFKNYPVSLNVIEECTNSLDNHLNFTSDTITETELFAIYFQITFGLAVAQKHYQFCHNDLHTENVMYNTTNQKYLYYSIYGINYRIPTFGKIYKIIDFARATYKFNKFIYFSNVFDEDGEAENQYTYPSKYASTNPEDIVYPNPSFDLVRFSLTVKPFLTDSHDAVNCFIDRMTMKDNGELINDDENDFNLYIDIARTCHNALPIKILSSPEFNIFKVKYIPRHTKVVYIY